MMRETLVDAISSVKLPPRQTEATMDTHHRFLSSPNTFSNAFLILVLFHPVLLAASSRLCIPLPIPVSSKFAASIDSRTKRARKESFGSVGASREEWIVPLSRRRWLAAI
jgi:hypothetical protein